MNQIYLKLEEVQLSELTPQLNEVIAKAGAGRFLRFKDAVLARAEVNRNRDELTTENLQEVAATLPLTPIDVEHKKDKNIGIFSEAYVKNGALFTGGLVWADRFPEEVEAIKRGEMMLSIEAVAEQAGCSICGNWFTARGAYCEHLVNQNATKANRRLKNATGIGGAITKIPAGTNTKFDGSQLYLFASLRDDDKEQSMDKPTAAQAAQELFASFVQQFADVLQWNPGSELSLKSPVMSPVAYHPGNPAEVNRIAAMPAAPTTPTKPTQAQPPAEPPTQASQSAPPAPMATPSEQPDELKQVLAKMLERLEALETKVSASLEKPTAPAPVRVGVVGATWTQEQPKQTATDKIRIVASR